MINKKLYHKELVDLDECINYNRHGVREHGKYNCFSYWSHIEDFMKSLMPVLNLQGEAEIVRSRKTGGRCSYLRKE